MTARGVRFAESQSSFADEGAAGTTDAVVKEFREALARAPEMAVAVAAIKARKRERLFRSLPANLDLNLHTLNSKLKTPKRILQSNHRPSRASSSARARQR